LKTCKSLTIVGIQMGASTMSYFTNIITGLLFGGQVEVVNQVHSTRLQRQITCLFIYHTRR